ncbi:MAG TPA: MBL fold metallo-hydrolase, partial [Hyphomonas sp.]|nr:MBL fold metallo-hydrolase [Hyphomonas sp.]
FNSDEAMTVSSMEAFEARADALGAKVIIQHEPADIDPLEGKIR